jgi:hypothetical protein
MYNHTMYMHIKIGGDALSVCEIFTSLIHFTNKY